MVTVFRTTAIAKMDSRGYRVRFDVCDRQWNDAAKAEHIERNGRPCPMLAFDVADDEAESYRSGARNGFTALPGDLTTPVEPQSWEG